MNDPKNQNSSNKNSSFIAPSDEELRQLSPEEAERYRAFEEKQRPGDEKLAREIKEREEAEKQRQLAEEERLTALKEQLNALNNDEFDDNLSQKKTEHENALKDILDKENKKKQNAQKQKEILEEIEKLENNKNQQSQKSEDEAFVDDEDDEEGLREDDYNYDQSEEYQERILKWARLKNQKQKEEEARRADEAEAMRMARIRIFLEEFTHNKNAENLPPLYDDRNFKIEVRDDNGSSPYIHYHDQTTNTEFKNFGTNISISFDQKYHKNGKRQPMEYKDATSFVEIAKSNGWKSLRTFGARRDRKMIQMAAEMAGMKVENPLVLNKKEKAFFEDLKKSQKDNTQQVKENGQDISKKEAKNHATSKNNIEEAYQATDEYIKNFGNRVVKRVESIKEFRDENKKRFDEKFAEKVANNPKLQKDSFDKEDVIAAQLGILKSRRNLLVGNGSSESKAFKKEMVDIFGKKDVRRTLELVDETITEIESNNEPVEIPTNGDDKNAVLKSALIGHQSDEMLSLRKSEDRDVENLANTIDYLDRNHAYRTNNFDKAQEAIHIATQKKTTLMDMSYLQNHNAADKELGYHHSIAKNDIKLALDNANRFRENGYYNGFREVCHFIEANHELYNTLEKNKPDPDIFNKSENSTSLTKMRTVFQNREKQASPRI